jgi:hypothetical protein
MATIREDQRGFALPAAIGALVIMGVLVTAGFFVSQQEVRIGVASKHANMAVNIAQTGANEAMARSVSLGLTHIPTWGDTTVTGTVPDGAWDVRVRRMSMYQFHLTAEGVVTSGGELWSGASRTLGINARIIGPDLYPNAALTTRNQITLRGGASVQGTDSIPTSWEGTGVCADMPDDDRSGILTDDSTLVDLQGTSSVDGAPPVDEDATIADSTFTDFGDEFEWADMIAMATPINALGSPITNTLPDSTGPGACDTSVLSNWGDSIPAAACGWHFPILYYNGDVTIQSSSYGQGILLVDGNLLMQGGYTFFGLIIVQGSFSTAGAGARIFGSVLAGNAALNDVAGASIIQSSQCATKRAILHSSASFLRPLAERSWTDLTAVAN